MDPVFILSVSGFESKFRYFFSAFEVCDLTNPIYLENISRGQKIPCATFFSLRKLTQMVVKNHEKEKTI